MHNAKTALAFEFYLYKWQGVNDSGAKVKGKIYKNSDADLLTSLQEWGITQVVFKKYKPSFLTKFIRITKSDVNLFTRQLTILLESNLTMDKALELLANNITNIKFKLILNDIRQKINLGETLAQSFAHYPKLFNSFYCGILDAGSRSAKLPELLNNLVAFQENNTRTIIKIRKALYYPLFILIFGILVAGFLMVKVLPEFRILFFNFGAELPWVTQTALDFSNYIQNHYIYIFAIAITTLLIVYFLHKFTTKGSYFFNLLLFKIPLIKKIMIAMLSARFAKLLALSINANISMAKTLEILELAIGNKVFAKKIEHMCNNLVLGQKLSIALSHETLFPKLLAELVATGETTGKLTQILQQASEFYELETQNYLDKITSLLEPLIMLILGFIIGYLVIAIYMPIFTLNSAIGG